MGASEHIKAAMKDKNISQAAFCRKNNINYQSLRHSLCADKMEFATVERYADMMDCEVVLRDRHTGKIY